MGAKKIHRSLFASIRVIRRQLVVRFADLGRGGNKSRAGGAPKRSCPRDPPSRPTDSAGRSLRNERRRSRTPAETFSAGIVQLQEPARARRATSTDSNSPASGFLPQSLNRSRPFAARKNTQLHESAQTSASTSAALRLLQRSRTRRYMSAGARP